MATLDDLRVLLVEDDALVSMMVEIMLEELGCSVVATAASVPAAMDAAASGGFDLAVLDINLAGRQSFPVAEVLGASELPFVFASGYGEGAVPDRFRTAPVVTKPFEIEQLRETILTALDNRGRGA